MTGIPKGNYESFQVVQYQEGQYYKPHHDSSNANKDRIAGHRVLTFLLYLNDVGEGGETKFPDLGIAVKPKKVSAELCLYACTSVYKHGLFVIHEHYIHLIYHI